MNPLVQFSPFAGILTKEIVPGMASLQVEFENDVHASSGADRSMWCYAPVSGCPDPKQTQILFVLRDDASCGSAESLLEDLGLAALAEKEHFLILFPDPGPAGWNTDKAEDRKSDIEFLVRCFGFLRESKIGVNGFNGMLFYLAVTPSASALIADMIAQRPGEVSAAMLTALPAEYTFPEDSRGIETAAWCTPGLAAEYLLAANGVRTSDPGQELRAPYATSSCASEDNGSVCFYRGENPEVRLFISDLPVSTETVLMAWNQLFSVSRRWQNDTWGNYHCRTSFTERGFIAHVSDSSLGVNDGFPHTWYEYIPPQLRECCKGKSDKGLPRKIPLVFYFHGVNCVPLYGAEQSLWHDIADRENLIVVYPAPARFKAWNIYDLPSLPSDIAFVLALLEHMKETWPIDESRVYLSGFSMGGAMTHALSSIYPELFTAAAPCNAFSFSRYIDPWENLGPFVKEMTEKEIGHVSFSAALADQKKNARPGSRMPLFQSAGAKDNLIAAWPAGQDVDDIRSKTLNWWAWYNNIPGLEADPETPSGFRADEECWMDESRRFYHQRWYSRDAGRLPLMELTLAGRMEHAVDPVELEWAWEYMKQFSRKADGTIVYTPGENEHGMR